ncbi:MAG: hypothetical protein M3020_00085 [Myxococcota bacterium]|nr:hypothetical protein [Myxococcota bacterium]
MVPENASARLAQELAKKVRDRGLVLWLDADRQYDAFVDALGRHELDFEYPVVGFRGSYLELMLALEPYGNGLYPEKVLVHLPRLNKETVKETPVFELYKAGTVFEKGLGTLVREAAVGSADAGGNRELFETARPQPVGCRRVARGLARRAARSADVASGGDRTRQRRDGALEREQALQRRARRGR